jgi:hypothetical protein
MKIKLTEAQYNRLLTEEDQDFGRLTDKVTPFIVKLFKLIEKQLPSNSNAHSKVKFLQDVMALPLDESLIVAYNYHRFFKDNIINWDNMLGKPLKYMGIYEVTTSVPMTADLYGRGYGEATIYALGKSAEQAFENVKSSHSYIVDDTSIEDGIEWDYDVENIEVENDMLVDNFQDDYHDGVNPFVKSTNISSNTTLHDLILNL